MRGKLIFSPNLAGIGGKTFHQEPVDLVLTKQTAVRFGERKGVAKTFAASLVGITERATSPFGAPQAFAAKIEDVPIVEPKAKVILEQLGFFFAETTSTSKPVGSFLFRIMLTGVSKMVGAPVDHLMAWTAHLS